MKSLAAISCVANSNIEINNFINENRIEKIPNISCDRDYTLDEIISSGGGIFATNSLFIRKEAYAMRPEVFDTKGFGDYQMFMYGAISGVILKVFHHKFTKFPQNT